MQITDVETFTQYESWNSEIDTGKGIVISWVDLETLGIGFGELSIYVDDNGKVMIDTESMGKDHFLKLMELLYDMAEVK